MPAKVLHVISSMSLGGAQRCLKQLVENSSEDIEAFVYPLRNTEDISINGNVIRLDLRNYSLSKFFALTRMCNKLGIDIIHAHLEKPILGALLASLFCNVKVIVHEHGPILDNGFKRAVYRFLLKMLKRRADKFIAVSKAVSNKLAEVGADPVRIEVVYNSVDRNVFVPDACARDQLRKEFDVKDDEVVVGYAGRLSYEKGTDLLVAAMQHLLESHPECVLLMAGNGGQRAELENIARRKGIERRVRFAGFVEDVNRIMNAFDIGVVPSRREAFGLTAIELMSVKVPVVCSGTGGLKELITDGQTGIVCSVNDPEHIAESIKQLIDDSELKERIVEAAYNESAKYSVEQYVKNVEAVYRDLLEGKH